MLRARKRGPGRGRGALGACCAAAGLALILAACGPVSAGTSSVGTTPVSGGTATYATLPGFPVNYILPFDPPAYFNVTNSDDFQYLLYRPLYWFGKGSSPYLNSDLSLAYPPVYKNQQVTIKLKPYSWSNGTPVTAQDVVFWINMMRAEDGLGNWGGYVQGDFPDDVTNVRAVGSTEVTMTIKKAYSELWFTDNELSQITPMPQSWDRTATGPSDCTRLVSACTGVFNYLNGLSTNMTSWARSPIWSVVDGPWRVTRATNEGLVTLALNKSYSGRAQLPSHHVSQFVLEPFTSEQAEFNVLQDPQANERVDVGYLPTVDAPVPAPGALSGGNPVSMTSYRLSVLYPWQLSYFPYNFTNSTAGPIFSQLYFRQAFQSLVDQEGVIDGPMHGYGKPTIGPVADYPVTQYLSPGLLKKGDQWELNPTYAGSLLTNHGWRNVKGVDTCEDPGSASNQCGPGVKPGATLDFSLIFATGVDWMYSSVKELTSNASLIGIKITPEAETADDVVGTAFCSPAPGAPCPGWQLAEWGEWSYSPDFLPTGEELFASTSGINAGHYDSLTNDALINKTLAARTTPELDQAMYTWEDYLAGQLPVVYTPDVPQLIESVNNLDIGPLSPTLTINPEDWYYLK